MTSDLPEPLPAAPAARNRVRRWIVSVFGDSTLTGAWRAEGSVVPVSVFGDIELDLRKTTVTADRIDITATTPFGDIDVLVPPGVEVDVGGFTLFGNKKITAPAPVTPGSGPLVRIRTFSIFGSINVRST